MKSKKVDSRDFIIGILVALVFLEAIIIFSQKPKARQAAVPPIKKERAAAIKPVPEKLVIGRIAVIIDDWGYNAQHCNDLSRIKYPVTVSILPNLEHTSDIAHCARRFNKEVMLHLPMEPHKNDENYPEGYLIKTSMDKEQIEQIVNRSLASVGYAVGVNNHMGSKVTEDKRAMGTIFSILKQKGIFFVDSMVTSASICKNLAKEMNIPFAQRHIFLDNKNERAYIENQFALLAQEARKRGFAVGIGHDRSLSLEIIKEQTEALEKEGFKFVTVGEMVRK